MAISVGQSSVVTNGLVLYLDAASHSNFKPLTEVEVLVVAGGGAGGVHHGGAGGGGGVLYSTSYSVSAGSVVNLTVGNGGTQQGAGGGLNGSAPSGQNSVFGNLTAVGGGGGGNCCSGNGAGGGSGGGAHNWNHGATGGAGTAGQGFNGGSNDGNTNFGGGGGGAGGPATGAALNTGGNGLAFSISGLPRYYGGGGGAGVYPGYTYDWAFGLGGLGGGGWGGNGPHNTGTTPQNGAPNTGGGGGGGADLYKAGGIGGSGVVVVRYPGPQKANGGTVTQAGGYTIHTFTTSSTFTPFTEAQLRATFYGLNDLSGNNSAFKSGGVTYSSDNGGVLLFDYTSGVLLTNSMQGYQYPNGITVSVWLYNVGGTVVYRGVVTNGTVADRTGGFDLRYGRENYFGGANNGTSLYWAIKNSSNTSVGVVVNANLNEWHNYVGTYDNNTVRIYKDGSLFASANGPGGQLKTMGDSTTIGRSPGTNEFLDGRLGNVMIYDRALSEAEILQNFNTHKRRFGL